MSNYINHCLMFQDGLIEIHGKKQLIYAHEKFNNFLHQNPNVEVLHFDTQEHPNFYQDKEILTFIYCVIRGPAKLHFDRFSQAVGVVIGYNSESEAP